ncbi:hypothetical protein T07_12466, partial [Trichinella nelsoni]
STSFVFSCSVQCDVNRRYFFTYNSGLLYPPCISSKSHSVLWCGYSNQILNCLEHFPFASINMEPQHKMVRQHLRCITLIPTVASILSRHHRYHCARAEGELGCFSWGISTSFPFSCSVQCDVNRRYLVTYNSGLLYPPCISSKSHSVLWCGYSNQILNCLEHFPFASINMVQQHKMVFISLSNSNPYRPLRLCSASTQWQKRMEACPFFSFVVFIPNLFQSLRLLLLCCCCCECKTS